MALDQQLDPKKFFDTHLISDLDSNLRLETLYRLYDIWCRDQEFNSVGKKRFAKYLTERGIENRGGVVFGVKAVFRNW